MFWFINIAHGYSLHGNMWAQKWFAPNISQVLSNLSCVENRTSNMKVMGRIKSFWKMWNFWNCLNIVGLLNNSFFKCHFTVMANLKMAWFFFNFRFGHNLLFSYATKESKTQLKQSAWEGFMVAIQDYPVLVNFY